MTEQGMVVVTGGAAGIGRETARLLGASGVPVAVLDADGAGAESGAVAAISAGAPDALGLRCDVTCETELSRAVRQAAERFDTVPSGLFAAAGVDLGGPAHELPMRDWSKVLDVNLTGAYLAARTVIAEMLEHGTGGSLVLCSSPAAFAAFSAGGTSAYSASKGGVSALVRSLAIDYASAGIRVNSIVPGPTETTLMWAGVPESERDAMREQLNSEVPLGRMADAEEPARAALWLLGGESSYVTGSQLVCDGGVLAKASVSV